MRYKIFASPREEISSGWVWLCSLSLKYRSVVKIKNVKNSKTVYCEALKIDKNFLSYYNTNGRIHIENAGNSIVINEWYRCIR